MATSAPEQQKDFQLRPLPTTPEPAQPQNGQVVSRGAPVGGTEYGHGASSSDLVLAGGIFLMLTVIFFFVRGGVRRHLIAGRASLSAASSAGWAVFAFLVAVSGAVVFGFFGNLWNLLSFTVPMGVLILVTLILSIFLYSSAARGRR